MKGLTLELLRNDSIGHQ